MKNYAAGLGIVGMLISLLIIALLVVRAYGPSADSDHPSGATSALQLSPPPNFGRDPTSSKQFVADSICRSNCESSVRTCRATADGPEAQAKCDSQLGECVAGCK
jgi:hypothetical protein